MNKSNNLCEHGTLIQNGLDVKLQCNISNFNCSFIRWCSQSSCLKMRNTYVNCNGRRIDMTEKTTEKEKSINTEKNENIELKKEVITENNPKKNTQKSKKEKCKVLWIKNNKIAFNFKGFGISHEVKDDIKSEFIEVEYTGEIGNKNFKIKSIKEAE